MSDETPSPAAEKQHDLLTAEQFLPLVYDELRRLATARLAREKPGQTLQATALVHEAYLRLIGGNSPAFQTRAHFFAAAAEAMRRILVEHARRRGRAKYGGGWKRNPLEDAAIAIEPDSDDVLALDEALVRLAEEDAVAARLVELRYFAGLTIPQAAEILGMSTRKVDFLWSFARAWLRQELEAA
jgi:RNA polymerase sigma factor (TIGR02999 family)